MQVYDIELDFYWGKQSCERISYNIDETDAKLKFQMDGDMHEMKDKDPVTFMRNQCFAIIESLMPNNIQFTFRQKLPSGIKKAYCITYDLDDIIKMRKNDEKLQATMECEHEGCDEDCDPEWDWSATTVYPWFIMEVVNAKFVNLRDTFIKYKKLTILKGHECPVLQEPLNDSALILKKCKHLISGEAWYKIEINTVDGHHYRKCPMCRCSYQLTGGVHDVSSDVDTMLELLPELAVATASRLKKEYLEASSVKAFPKPERIPMD